MPELSEKVYPDGTVVKLRDDTAREQLTDINSALNNPSYSRSGLSTNAACTIIAGGYVQIGKLVVVNLRLQLNDIGGVVSGLPKPAITDIYNTIGGVAYNAANETVGYFYVRPSDGGLAIAGSSGSSGALLISYTYVAQ